jgi:hypothetical protein
MQIRQDVNPIGRNGPAIFGCVVGGDKNGVGIVTQIAEHSPCTDRRGLSAIVLLVLILIATLSPGLDTYCEYRRQI